MRLRELILAAALGLALASPAGADEITITDDRGGLLADYIGRYREARARGHTFRITGECDSACTLILGIVPRGRVCIASDAILGFHSASTLPPTDPDSAYSARGTRLLWTAYPAIVHAILRKRGWDGASAHPEIIPVRGAALRRLYRDCP